MRGLRTVVLGVLAVAVDARAALPAVTSPYYLHLLQTIAIYSPSSRSGLDIVFGYTGEVSIGHAALFGIGAYAAAIRGSCSFRILRVRIR